MPSHTQKKLRPILQHMHVIVTEKTCNEGDLVNDFINKAKAVKQAAEAKQITAPQQQ